MAADDSLDTEIHISTLARKRTAEGNRQNPRCSLGRENLPNGAVAEWTAPSTPVVLVYGPGKVLTTGVDHIVVVGDIGNLSTWIAEYRDYWTFVLNDVLLGLLSVVTGLLAFLETKR
jgi:hypothetical protein